MTDDILLRVKGHAGFISLNRPSALHALTLPMVHAMTEALLSWRDDDAVKCVVAVFARAAISLFCATQRSMMEASRAGHSSTTNISSTICCLVTPSP